MLLAIDPGPEKSGWVLFSNKLHGAGVSDNEWIKINILRRLNPNQLAIEKIISYGMPVGATTFETCIWVGRFIENFSGDVQLVTRKEVLKHFKIKDAKGSDSKLRAILIDKFVTKDGVKVTSHAWSAFAVAITALKL